ncbi:MAG: bifunctional UDP-N-acetylglucosamine diphosphorylase/glucosamine-1-phosphate N-acetyltransferase GlmU, partial [Gammaproteobacteria bacterium]|nr:bifunctional UDP-N-acetylglucosamine diphosphorylase/glucosamine-1-phosphate N-acetyltransferase GlmU [Gammaproteobacteria bacterium]
MPDTQLSIVILAAGKGTRMRSGLPKVLQPLAEKSLLGHVVDTAKQVGAAEIFVVYGHGGEEVQSAFADQGLSWALQEPQLGTGHAVQQAVPDIKDDHVVVVVYGDVPLVTPQTVQKLASAAADKLVLLTVEADNPKGYGRIVRNNAGKVQAIVEEKDASAEQRLITEVNTGLLACPAARIKPWLNALQNDNAQQEYYLTDIVAAAVADGIAVAAVKAISETEVMGINDKVQLAQAERVLQMQRATQLMQAGATVADPLRIDIRGTVSIGEDVFIDVNAVFEGEVELGNNVVVGPNVLIKNTRIAAGTHIHANSVLEDAVVGEKATIGPFARLRPNAIILAGARVGNFVEIKNTTLGLGSKANHLTYLGDAEIGAGVNVGCGTITCNYDG